MTPLDWLIVILINGAIVVYGLYISRGATKTFDWFLAAKGLPWWIVGLSMFATAVDSGDYVAIVGGAYTFGLSNLSTWWLGMPIRVVHCRLRRFSAALPRRHVYQRRVS